MADERPTPRAAPSHGRRLDRTARRPAERAVGRRQDRGREAVRGPRPTPSSTTCPASSCRTSPSSSSRIPSASRGSRSCSTCAPATRRRPTARCAARSRAGASGRRSSSSRRATRRSSGGSRRPATGTRWRPAGARRLRSTLERRLLDPIRAESDVVLDTTDLPLRELQERLFARIGDLQPGPDDDPAHQLRLQVRHPARGGPRVRHAVHPEPVLRPRAARALRPDRAGARRSCSPSPARRSTSTSSHGFLEFSIPAFAAEGKSRLTIAIGCTGGRHRSIVFAEELAAGCATRATGRSRSSTASWSGDEARDDAAWPRR